jgi:3-oxoacyl-[acyl-carrier protein] reductase
MLADRIAFVTGSTRGIGWATARALASAGAKVVVNSSSSQDAVDARVAELKESGSEAMGVVADVSDSKAVQEAYRQIFNAYRRLDVVVNNAGIMSSAVLGMISDADAQRTFAVNALGTLHSMQAATRLMMRGSGGSIINVTSIVGTVGAPGYVAYGGAKAAVIGMTRAAAKELGARQIRVNAVAPGFIDTQLLNDVSEEVRKSTIDGIKMGRIGTVDDVTGTVLYLACDMSSYVTGQVIGVDGGMLI